MTREEIYNYFRDHEIKTVTVNYSGSGDDGGVDYVEIIDKKGVTLNNDDHKSFVDTLEEIVFDTSNPDFNNEGSEGDASFTFDEEEEVVKLLIDHRDPVIDYTHTAYDIDLVDAKE